MDELQEARAEIARLRRELLKVAMRAAWDQREASALAAQAYLAQPTLAGQVARHVRTQPLVHGL